MAAIAQQPRANPASTTRKRTACRCSVLSESSASAGQEPHYDQPEEAHPREGHPRSHAHLPQRQHRAKRHRRRFFGSFSYTLPAATAFDPRAPGKVVYKLTCRGNKGYQTGQYKSAVKAYTEALCLSQTALHPRYASDFATLLYANRSAAYCGLRRYKEALKDAEIAVRIRPWWSKGHFRKGEALLGLHNFEHAVVAFQSAWKCGLDNQEIVRHFAKSLLHVDNLSMGVMVLQLRPGRDICLRRTRFNIGRRRLYQYAKQMKTYVYVIADTATRECLVVDPCWDIHGILRIIRNEGLQLVGSIVTEHRLQRVGGAPTAHDKFRRRIPGLSKLLKVYPEIPAYVHPADIPHILRANPSLALNGRSVRLAPPALRRLSIDSIAFTLSSLSSSLSLSPSRPPMPLSSSSSTAAAGAAERVSTRSAVPIPQVVPTSHGRSIRLGATTRIRFVHGGPPGFGSQCVYVNDCRLITGDAALADCRCTARADSPRLDEESRSLFRAMLCSYPDDTVVYPGHECGECEWTTVGREKSKMTLREL